MATSDGQQGCQDGTGSHVTGSEALRTFSSSSSSFLLTTSSSSLPSSLSSSSTCDDVGDTCDYFTLRHSNESVWPGTTPSGSTSPPARLASPRGGVEGPRRLGAVTLTPTPRMPAPPHPQAQPTALVTPCSRVNSMVGTGDGPCGGGDCGASVREEGRSMNGASKVDTHPSAPAPSPTSKSFSASLKSISPAPTMSSQTSSLPSHSRVPSAPSDAVPHTPGPVPGPCSVTCSNNFAKLSKELSEAKDQLFALSVQMAEQSSHINKLMEENRRYIKENGKLKKKSVSRSGATLLNPNNFDHFGSGVSSAGMQGVDGDYGQTDEMLTELQDRIMALQMHNDELSVCLEQEKRKRREAEERVERDEGYIKRLEDSVQTLRGTRVVMDSGAYRQLAEAYIAARRPPARRPHTHVHAGGSDLVCDSSSGSALSMPRLPLQTSSYPCSPKSDSSIPSSTSSSQSIYPEDSQLYPSSSRNRGSVRGPKEKSTIERSGRSIGGATMNPWEYQQLLESLEDLDGASRGALS